MGHLHHHSGCNHPPLGLSPLISKKKQGHTRETDPPDAVQSLTRRQRKKGMTQGLVKRLLEVADPEGKMLKQYHRAYHCGSVIEQHDGVLTTSYCKSKVCLVCNGIRTAMLIDAYTPIVETWIDPVMVSLTVPNPPLADLRDTVVDMQRKFSLCLKAIRRAGNDVKAIRTIEVTEGNVPGHVHPHFHVLVSGEAVGTSLVDEWLKRYPMSTSDAQDVTRVNTGGLRGSLKELFKYVTKLSDPTMPATVLDGILTAMWGKHLVRPYGFRLDIDPMEDEAFDELVPTNEAFKRIDEHILWTWIDELGTWVDGLTGDMLLEGTHPVGFA